MFFKLTRGLVKKEDNFYFYLQIDKFTREEFLIMKKLKKSLCTILSVTMLVLMVLTVYATTYTSTLSLSFRSTNRGAYRDYIGSRHKISLTLKSRDNISTDNYCNVSLERKQGLSYTTSGSAQVLNIKDVGSTYSASWSGQKNGQHRHYFTNRYLASDYRYTLVDGFYCDQVVMTSN